MGREWDHVTETCAIVIESQSTSRGAFFLVQCQPRFACTCLTACIACEIYRCLWFFYDYMSGQSFFYEIECNLIEYTYAILKRCSEFVNFPIEIGKVCFDTHHRICRYRDIFGFGSCCESIECIYQSYNLRDYIAVIIVIRQVNRKFIVR